MLCLITIVFIGATAVANQRQVVVRPDETDELFANPDMGWETFHRTSEQDKELPRWIPSTVNYARWGWAQLEPRPGRIDSGFLDKVLKETRDSGQTLAFRVMCCSSSPKEPYHPKWLTALGGRELLRESESYGLLRLPDFDDPIVLDRHLDFIKRLGESYDGHPDIAHVDIGSIGFWGEWNMSGCKTCQLPRPENRKKVVDAYLNAFKKTPLLMLIGGGECLKYACDRGAGWRADCLGDMGGFSKHWSHMRQGYPTEITSAGIEDVWKTAPVAFESCWDMRKWTAEGWSLRYIFNYALACHASYINDKSAPLPPGEEVRAETERFLRRLGYRLVLKELRYPATAKVGATMDLAMKWQNRGSAPCYRPYRLAYRLANDAANGRLSRFSRNENGTVSSATIRTVISHITVDHWLPGSVKLFTADFFNSPADLPPGEVVDVSDRILLPSDLPAGRYVLSIAIVGDDEKPLVRLAIKGRAKDGWYPLGKVQVVKD